MSRLSCLLALALSLSCATEITCPETDAEAHLDTQESSPGGLSVMLHQVGRECPVVGDNVFSVDGMVVTEVDAVMTDMGHGSTVDPVIAEDGDLELYFQMPGSWELSLTGDGETVSFALDVVDP